MVNLSPTGPGKRSTMTALEFLTAILSTFGLILLAEIGDKSQLVCMTLAARHPHPPVLLGAVAGLAVTLPPLAVWLGATLALITTSAQGIWLGVTLLRRIPIHRLHQVSGVFFLALAAFAAAQWW